MKHRGRLTFEFFETKEKAEQFVKSNKLRKYSITPWNSQDGKENLFVLLYHLW